MSSATAASDANDSSNGSTKHDIPDFSGVIDTDVFDPFVRHVKPLIDEYKVVVNSKGLHIRVTDTKTAVLFDVRISNEDFKQYDMNGGGVMGVSHKRFEEGLAFASETMDEVHVSVNPETAYMTLSDGEHLFMDIALIDPDSVRTRPNKLYLETRSTVTFSDTDMWDFKKWVRSNKSETAIGVLSNESGTVFSVDNGDSLDFSVESGGPSVERSFSVDHLYQFVKKPLKSHLTEVDYHWTFSEEGPLMIEREWGENSRLEYMVAPRIS